MDPFRGRAFQQDADFISVAVRNDLFDSISSQPVNDKRGGGDRRAEALPRRAAPVPATRGAERTCRGGAAESTDT